MKPQVKMPNHLREPSIIERKSGQTTFSKERELIRKSQSFDRYQGIKAWGVNRTPIAEVEKSLGSVRKDINQLLRKNKVVEVLDLGCGSATALNELKKRFKGRIRTTGFTTLRNPYAKYRGVDQLITGFFRKRGEQEKYHYSYSNFGTTYHTAMISEWIKRITWLLSPGGKAIFTVRDDEPVISKVESVMGALGKNVRTHIRKGTYPIPNHYVCILEKEK